MSSAFLSSLSFRLSAIAYNLCPVLALAVTRFREPPDQTYMPPVLGGSCLFLPCGVFSKDRPFFKCFLSVPPYSGILLYIGMKKAYEVSHYPIGTRSSGLTKDDSAVIIDLTVRLVSEVFVFGTCDTEVANRCW